MPQTDDDKPHSALTKTELIERMVRLSLKNAVVALHEWRSTTRADGMSLNDLREALAPGWLSFWSEKLSSLVVQQGDAAIATPGVAFDEVLDATRLDFSSRVYTGERGIRRVRDDIIVRELHVVRAKHEARDGAVRDDDALRLARGA